MYIHIPTGLEFENRKQAVLLMGQKRYRKALKNREFLFPNYYNGKETQD